MFDVKGFFGDCQKESSLRVLHGSNVRSSVTPRAAGRRTCRERASIQALAGTSGCQRRSSRSKALASTTSLRMTAVIATLCGLPRSASRW